MKDQGSVALVEPLGVCAAELSDGDLFRELQSLYRTRLGAMRHAPLDAWAMHNLRMNQLEREYIRRRPEREVDRRRARPN